MSPVVLDLPVPLEPVLVDLDKPLEGQLPKGAYLDAARRMLPARTSPFVIAEVGVNHNGDIDQARYMVSMAKECGADAVKFQLFDAERLGRPEIKWLELSRDEIIVLYREAERVGIEFMCTPFHVDALEFLAPLVKRMKISSGCLTDLDLLRAAADTRLPIVLSTGMSSEREIEAALDIVTGVTLLHCTSSYPCPLEDVNLKAMVNMREHFRLPVGYSDHTNGILAPVIATTMDACVIEKHFTVSTYSIGPDHKASLDPQQFKRMVQSIKETVLALGDGVKRPMSSESETMKVWKR